MHTHTHTREPTTPQFTEPREHDATGSPGGFRSSSSLSSSLFCQGSQKIASPPTEEAALNKKLPPTGPPWSLGMRGEVPAVLLRPGSVTLGQYPSPSDSLIMGGVGGNPRI